MNQELEEAAEQLRRAEADCSRLQMEIDRLDKAAYSLQEGYLQAQKRRESAMRKLRDAALGKKPVDVADAVLAQVQMPAGKVE